MSIKNENINSFIAATDDILKDISTEPIYYVDYIYNGIDVNPNHIIEIASLGNLWGKDMQESLIAIENLKITKSMISLLSPDKKPTLKITLPNKITAIKFGSCQEEYDNLLKDGYVSLNIVGKCNVNEWMRK